MEFQSFSGLLNKEEIETLREECRHIYNAKNKKASSTYSEGRAFWINADEEPRFFAEAYALRLFRHYTAAEKGVDGSLSGAEFWPLVIGAADGDVSPHYDKDYGAEDSGRHLYPRVGTVTYLADAGGSTVFFQQLECSPLPCDISRGWLSKVASGKLVAFDGRLLHCASTQLVRSASPSSCERVTFLVNVWINHRPLDPIPCPYVPGAPFAAPSFGPFPAPDVLPAVPVSEDAVLVEMKIDPLRLLHFRAPMVRALKASSVLLLWAPGTAAVSKPSRKKDAAAVKKSRHGRR